MMNIFLVLHIKTKNDFSERLAALYEYKQETVAEVWDQSCGTGSWNLKFLRAVNDWEIEGIANLLKVIRKEIVKIQRKTRCCGKG